MAIIYESKNFVIEAPDAPLVGREDGGHVVINPKNRMPDLQQLPAVQAIELMRLLMAVGQAMATVLNRHGVDVGRINYQDNGNWGVFTPEGPYQHFHLYGRAISAKKQTYGQACHFPHRNESPEFYDDCNPLTDKDITGIRNEITSLLSSEKYADAAWYLPDQPSI